MVPEQRNSPLVVFGAGGRAGLAVVAGDLTDSDSVSSVVPGKVAGLVNAVTPFTAPPESFADFDPDYYVRLVRNLAQVARESRVIEIGLAATLRTASGRVYEDPTAFPASLRPFAEARMNGLASWQETTKVDWLVITPPPGLSLEAPATGEYRLRGDVLDPQAASIPLSYADLATAVLDQVEKPTVTRQQVTVYG
ncbi:MULTISPECIES: NAD(P)-dependent oxidoreductase [Amycolatopsis]|uniref:NAD(P)-dependent oxidoreductase n=1 Tax=Amycolatopsis TaxID=1813 RepID=UPI00106E76CD|nr:MULTISPECIES: flavin reductase [Amycolatopsis]